MNCGISASIPPSASPINTLVNLRELYPDRFLGLDFSKNIKGILLFVLFGYGTSPVLKTLTDTISSDTVFGMSVGMMFLHLAFFDYGLQASINIYGPWDEAIIDDEDLKESINKPS
ncbi:Phosphatidylinositol N-acetylglucosaminyltransferase subunit C [Nymphon striatum]|nr:Phosphatidylinositol N-acetylglucosaminyltransferase subunit C [Nymphon striatum]